MENGLTRAITIAALTGLLVAGAAATGILAHDAWPEPAPPLAAASPQIQEPVSNEAAKRDRLPVAATLALAAFEPQPPAAEATQSLRLAFASTTAGIEPSKPVAAAPVNAPEAAKPRLVTRPSPPPQKPYTLLSDAQIATIKERLRLSADQESYWPAVETALRAVARKIHATREATAHASGAPPIDPDSAEVQQLKSAAMPLLFQLREDQKREVRTLARLIGLEKVASLI
jgi:hypothetical protein